MNVVFITSLSIITSFIPFFENLDNHVVEGLKENSVLFFVLLLIVGPFFETLIFQAVIISVIRFLLSQIQGLRLTYINIVAIIISAIAFGFNHGFSLAYGILGGLVGLILATSYIICINRKWHPLLIVFLIHSLANFTAWLYNSIFYT